MNFDSSMESTLPETGDLLTLARNRVRVGSVPEWVTPSTYNLEFAAKVRRPVTPLLLERQAHAELREHYFHHALRLETIQAVQDHSQWRVEFTPKMQWVVLHSVKTKRGTVEREHLSLEKIQFLQREAGLEGCVIDGGITLLLLLEDVVVGDVLECSYTITSEPPLLPKNWSVFVNLPLASEIGKHYFSVRHGLARQMKWKSSSQSIAPVVTIRGDDEVELVWQGENVITLEPEEGMPLSVILYPWIQFSDFPDWQTVARGVAEAWPADVQGDGIQKLLQEIKSAGPELPRQVNKAIKIVQDGFRYLSVNVELGGCIPADPETVIRRRYGDCKDLALLLTRLLEGLGVSARPVLVHVGLRHAISSLLPSPGFNHAIVEFQLGEERRWIDATTKFQGGIALNRIVTDFGVGLPVDPNATELVSVPKASLPAGTFEMKDSFLLDTAGRPSYLSVTVTAKGVYAEQLRAEFETAGSVEVSKRRLQACANRFYKAARAGEMQWRDDREKNELVIAEVFEIDGFLRKQANSCLFEIRSEAGAALRLPPQIVRRDPFGLPYPCHQTHIVEIDFQGLDFVKIHAYESNSKFFTLTRQVKSVQKYLKATFTVRMLADVVPAKEIGEHRKQVETAWRACGFVLQLPLGYARMRKRDTFGALPDAGPAASAGARLESKTVESAAPATVYVPDHLTTATKAEPASPVATAKQSGEKHTFVDPRTTIPTRPGERKPIERYSGSSRHSHRRYNLKCALSLGLVIAAVWLLVIGIITAASGYRGSGHRLAGGMLGMLTIVMVPAAVVLAIVGLRDLAKNPRKTGGRGMAIATLWIGGLMGLILVPMIIAGIKGGIKGWTRARERIAYAKLLRFPVEQFVFHTPDPPWMQVDSRNFGPMVVAGFAEPGPITSTVMVTNLGPAAENMQGTLVNRCKEGERHVSNPWRIVSEGNVERNGVTGWQFESVGYFQGHEMYAVTWVVTTNGFGYVLRTLSRVELTDRTKEGADYFCSRFEPMAQKNGL